MTDRSRRPFRYANKLPFQVENYILNAKREHASWGARKIRERLLRRFSGIPIPARSTNHAVLDRHGLVERKGRYLAAAREPLVSIGAVLVDTGLRPEECYRLMWESITWCNGRNGTLLVTHGKTKAARRSYQ